MDLAKLTKLILPHTRVIVYDAGLNTVATNLSEARALGSKPVAEVGAYDGIIVIYLAPKW